MANNYQAYMQSRNANTNQQPIYTGAPQQSQTPIYESQMQIVNSPFGFKEVDGLNGVNRYPVAPGNAVALKDINSMTVFVKTVDMSGSLLPLRVFQLTEVTQEYLDKETPVSRAEFNQLSENIGQLANSMTSMQKLLEDLTAPAEH